MRIQNDQNVAPARSIAALAISLVVIGGLLPMASAVAKTHEVQMTAVETDIVVEGTGEKYAAWTFNGQFPGPVVRVTEGDTVKFTLTNPATNKNPHAMDFHAAEIDFLKNYRAVNTGETISFTFVAKKPGVFFLPLWGASHDSARGPWDVRGHYCGSQESQGLAEGGP